MKFLDKKDFLKFYQHATFKENQKIKQKFNKNLS